MIYVVFGMEAFLCTASELPEETRPGYEIFIKHMAALKDQYQDDIEIIIWPANADFNVEAFLVENKFDLHDPLVQGFTVMTQERYRKCLDELPMNGPEHRVYNSLVRMSDKVVSVLGKSSDDLIVFIDCCSPSDRLIEDLKYTFSRYPEDAESIPRVIRIIVPRFTGYLFS